MEAREYFTTIETEPDERSTDMDNAARLVEDYGNRLRYVEGLGWLLWDGRRWEQSKDGPIELAKDVVYDLRKEAADTQDFKRHEALSRHARRSAARERIYGMVDLAKTDPRVRRRVEDFDANPMLFNVANGTIDLTTGTLLDHEPEDHITRISPVTYDPEARSDVWDKFIRSITCEDAELAEFLQRAAGYSLTGKTTEKGFLFCYGPQGDNGKSTFLEALLHVMGDYGQALRPETILAGQGGSIPNDVARLVGRRFVTTSEPEEGESFNLGLIKRLTGSDTVQARFLRQEFFEFKPVLKLWLAANDRPDVRDSGDAVWGRIKMVPFNAHYPKGHPDRDEDLPRKLREAAPAILAWMVEGCLRWYDQGLNEPAVMREAVKDYRSDQDPVYLFVQERCSPGEREEANKVHSAYNSWAMGNDQAHLSQQALYKALEKQGYTKRRSHGKTWIEGLTLSTGASADDDDLPF